MKRFYLSVIILLTLVLTGCEKKVTCLHYNENDGVLEISKSADLCYIAEVAERNKLNEEPLLTDNGRKIALHDACLRLVKDIEINGNWTPIPNSLGSSIKSFDGNNHRVTFRDVEYILPATEDGQPAKSEFMYFGLFERLDYCEVRNLLMEGELSVRNKNITDSYYIHIGTIAGGFGKGAVENCKSRVKISFEDEKGRGKLVIGGIIGEIENLSDPTILTGEIVNEGDITVRGCYSVSLGGVAGTAGSSLEMVENVNLKNMGNMYVEWDKISMRINNEDSYNFIGGVFGRLEVSDGPVRNLDNCGNIVVNTQEVAMDFNLGGVCGEFGKSSDGKNLIYVYGMKNSGTLKIEGKGICKYGCVGGVIGQYDSGYFHQLLNKGKIIIPEGSDLKVGGLFGSENGWGFKSYFLSCNKDEVGDFKIMNYSHFPLIEKVCVEKHDKQQE